MVEVLIEKVNETTYEDGTVWIGYTVGDKLGYEISSLIKSDCNLKDLEETVNRFKEIKDIFVNKPIVSDCGEFLAEIINDCRQSDNEMWFVEYEDLEEVHNIAPNCQEQFLKDIDNRISELGLDDYIKVHEDGCAVTVYGGVITKFLF